MTRLYTVATDRNALDFPTMEDALHAIAELRRYEARWPLARQRRVTLTSKPS